MKTITLQQFSNKVYDRLMEPSDPNVFDDDLFNELNVMAEQLVNHYVAKEKRKHEKSRSRGKIQGPSLSNMGKGAKGILYQE